MSCVVKIKQQHVEVTKKEEADHEKGGPGSVFHPFSHVPLAECKFNLTSREPEKHRFLCGQEEKME